MAGVILDEQSTVVVKPWWGQFKPVYVGAVAGLIWLIVAILMLKIYC